MDVNVEECPQPTPFSEFGFLKKIHHRSFLPMPQVKNPWLTSLIVFASCFSLMADDVEIIKEEMGTQADEVYDVSLENPGTIPLPDGSAAKVEVEGKSSAPKHIHFEERYRALISGPVDPWKHSKQIVELYVEVFKIHDWSSLLEKGREALMAQQLAAVTDPLPMLPPSLDKNFSDAEGLSRLKADLEKLDVLLEKMPQKDIQACTFYVRQTMMDKLVSKSHVPTAFSGLWKGSLRQQSNVTEAPEGQQNVSERSGLSMNHYLRLAWKLRKKNFGDPSLEARISDRRFEDDQFEGRESSSLFLKGKVVMDGPGGKKRLVQTMTPSLGLRFDYVNTNGSRELNSVTYIPAMNLVFRPIKGAGELSELFVSFLNTSLEQRNYQSGFNLNGLKEKDTTSFGMTWIGVNYDRFRDWRVKETAVVNWKSNSSDDDNLDYLNFSLDLSVSFEKGAWGFKPSLGYRQRDQDLYVNQSRKDDRVEFGVVTTRKFPRFESSLGLKIIDQDSSQSNFSYVDRRVAIGITKVF